MNRRILTAAAVLLCLGLANPGRADTSDLQTSIDSVREPIFDGLGSLHHPVTTKTNSTLAQHFFDQGLTFVYAFNHDEAADSFRQAAQLDPNLAMAYWGIALSLGPNINQPEDIDRGKMAYAAIVKAKSLEANASAPEREYIDALAQRYSPDGKMNDALQLAYANAMRKVAHDNPDDPDAGALFAESMMDLHPWGLWTLDGKPVDGTPELVAALEGVIAKYPTISAPIIIISTRSKLRPTRDARLKALIGSQSSRPPPAIPCTCPRISTFAPAITTRRPLPTRLRSKPTRFTCASAIPRASIRPCTCRTIFNSCGRRT